MNTSLKEYCITGDGDVLLAGDSWKANACTSCTCNNGTIQCFSQRCPAANCRVPVLRKGQCCPHCLGEWCVNVKAAFVKCQKLPLESALIVFSTRGKCFLRNWFIFHSSVKFMYSNTSQSAKYCPLFLVPRLVYGKTVIHNAAHQKKEGVTEGMPVSGTSVFVCLFISRSHPGAA